MTMGLKKDVKPREHQEQAVKRLLRSDGSLILAHDVGTGKTLTSIMGFEALRKKGKAKRALVVVPASLKRNFVEDGVKKFTTDSHLVLGNKQEAAHGGKNVKSIDEVTPQTAATYNVVSYDMFKKDPEKYLDRTKADTVIYDELHRAKNETSKITDVIKKVRGKHRNFIGMTATPGGRVI
jgi:superfamily II DNA or RNA helicase